MDLALTFTIISIIGWVISCFFWFWAALLPIPITLPKDNEGEGNCSLGDGGFIFHGYALPTSKELRQYIKKARFRNAGAAALSGVSALMSALSIASMYFQI